MGSLQVFAADTGNRIGKVYSTDIKAYMDGKPIDAYHINSKVGIVCEDLKAYGFNVMWEEKNRILQVSSLGQWDNTLVQMPMTDKRKAGALIGYLYRTNIVTYVNGKKIPSYNIGGKTIILLEDLTSYYGFITNRNSINRSVSTTPYRMNDTLKADVGECRIAALKTMFIGDYPIIINTGYLTLNENTIKLNNITINTIHEFYIPLIESLEQLGVSYTWDKDNNTLNMTNIPDVLELKGNKISTEKMDNKQVQIDDVLYYINMKVKVNEIDTPMVGSRDRLVWGELGYCVPFMKGPLVYKGIVYIPAPALAHFLNVNYFSNAIYKVQ